MVLAAPLFLVSQTKSMRGFYLANKQAFINLSMGFTGTYLGLSLLSKMSEVDAAKKEMETAKAQHAAVVARLTSASHLESLAACFGAREVNAATIERAVTLVTTTARVTARQEQQRLDEVRAAAGSSWWRTISGALVRQSRQQESDVRAVPNVDGTATTAASPTAASGDGPQPSAADDAAPVAAPRSNSTVGAKTPARTPTGLI